ncbi:hypothetical protein BH09SUM1_BH09SUM1_08310 [soil metagenome]
MKRTIFQPTKEELTRERAREVQISIIARYALSGFAIGAAIMVCAWYFVMRSSGMPLAAMSVENAHDKNQLLYLVDFAPLVLPALFGWLGRAQARFKMSNLDLEDRVRDRTLEITMEKARTSAILDSAADSIIAFAEDGRVTMYNNAADKLFGYKYSEAMGRNVRTLIPAFEETEGTGYVATVRDIQRPGRPGVRGFTGLRKDGTTIPIEVDISEFTLGDETSFTIIARDLSERKRSERLERSLLQVTEAVNQTNDLNQLYRAIHQSLGQVIDVTNFYIAMLDEDKMHYTVVFAVDEDDTERTRSAPLERSAVELVIRNRKPVLLGRRECEELVNRGEIVPRMKQPSVSWLGVPLISNNEPIGIMAVYSHEDGILYTERDVWVMNFVSGQIASAIEREHVREAIRASEKRYRRMVEEAGDIVYTTDLSGRFTYANPPILKLTGYEEQELIGQNSAILTDKEWLVPVRAFYTRQLRDRIRETVFEFPIMSKTGERRWIEQNATLMFESDRPAGFQAVVHDITERRNAESALREREERFRSLSASSPIGIFQVDEKGMCIYTNKRWQEITGKGLEESLGMGWLEAIHPDDRQTFKIEWMFSRDDTSAREVRVLRHSGEVRWVNIRWTSTFDETEQLTGYVGTFEDVTLRRKTEQLNAVLYEISQAAQTGDDLQEFFKSLHRSLSKVIDTTNLYVATYDRERETISFPYARESGVDLNLPERPVGKGLTGYVIRTGRHLLLDEEGLGRFYASGEAAQVGKPTKNWLGVPLLTKTGVMGAVILQSYTSSHFFSEGDVQTIIFVSSQIASAIMRKKGEEERRIATAQLAEAHGRIKEDLRLAARIQQSRLPRHKPATKDVEFAWLFDSCDEVAGDMFNYVQLNEHLIGIYILDVSGHGVPAALLSMSLSRSLTAAVDGSGALLRQGPDGPEIIPPAEVAEIMNRRYPMNLDINQYFTFLYGILDLRTMKFTFTRAGHPAPVFVTLGSPHAIEEGCGPAIGIIPEMKYEEVSVQLTPGDEVLFYTDGVDEAANGTGEEFGLERILQTLEAPEKHVEGDVKKLREAVRNFSEGRGQSDDITILAFRVRGQSFAGPIYPAGGI